MLSSLAARLQTLRDRSPARLTASRAQLAELFAAGAIAVLPVGAIAMSLFTGGCGPPGNTASDIAVTWHVTPDPPRVGLTTVAVVLEDSLGRPVSGAAVSLQATMTHPGMAPVVAEADELSPGRYHSDIDLSMAGDWLLLLDATLPDGRSLQREKSLSGVRDP